jgi:hypothetical protein
MAIALVAMIVISAVHADDHPKIDMAIGRATAWLIAQQASDGGWHSETYGSYRTGVGTTAIAVRALNEVGSDHTSQSLEKGLAFLTARRDERGFVVAPDGSSDNSMYATAITARLLANRKDNKFADVRDGLLKALADAQHIERDKLTVLDVGGWASLITSLDLVSRETPCNISATTAVLMARPPLRDRQAAVNFVNRCRNRGPGTHDDYGFFFTPHLDHPLNKMSVAATPSGGTHPVSYFPTTCDGLLALASLDVPSSPEQRRSEIQRLITLPRPVLNTTAPSADGPPRPMIDGLYFYSAAAFGELWARFPGDRERLKPIRDEMVKTILDRQNPRRGDWTNPVTTMREDDPLIATSLAIIALRNLAVE